MENLITVTGANPQFPLSLGMPVGVLAAGVEAKRAHVTRAAAATAIANVWGPDAWSPPV